MGKQALRTEKYKRYINILLLLLLSHLWQEFDSFMYDNMIDDTIESYWALTDKKDHKHGQKLWFSVLVLLAYWNAIAQN